MNQVFNDCLDKGKTLDEVVKNINEAVSLQ